MAEHDRRLRMRTLVLGFVDLAQRSLRAPGGVIVPPTPNRISLIVDEATRSGLGRLVLNAQGERELRLSGTPEQRADVVARLTAAVDSALTHKDRGAMLYGQVAGSDWQRVLANTPVVFDPASNELIALSREDLESTLGRLGDLESATTLRDPNLSYVKRTITEQGGQLRRAPDGNLVARFPTAAGARVAATALEQAKQIDPVRFRAVMTALEEHPRLLEYMMPGISPDQIRVNMPTERADFEDFSVRAKEAYRRLITRDRELSKEVGRADAQERSRGASPRNTGRGEQDRLGGIARTDIEANLDSMARADSGVTNSIDRQNSEQRRRLRLERNATRAFDAPDYVTATLLEAESMRALIEYDMARNPETTLYHRETDVAERLYDGARRAAKGEITSNAPWSGIATNVGMFNIEFVNAHGEYTIIPLTTLSEHCVGEAQLQANRWQEGIPPENVLRGWIDFAAPLKLSAAPGGGIAVSGDELQTLREFGGNARAVEEARVRQVLNAPENSNTTREESTAIEAAKLRLAIEKEIASSPRTPRFGSEFDLLKEMGHKIQSSKQAGLSGKVAAAQMTIGAVGKLNIVVVDAERRFAIVPLADIASHCIGVQARSKGKWNDGAPSEKTLQAWAKLEASLHIGPSYEPGPLSLRVFGGNVKTLQLHAKHGAPSGKATTVEELLEGLQREEQSAIDNLYMVDALETRNQAQSVAMRAFNLADEPMFYSAAALKDSMSARIGDGAQQSVATVPYNGIIVAKGNYHTNIYSDGAIYEHLTSAVGEHALGTSLSISYDASSNMEWANVRVAHSESLDRAAQVVREFVGRFDEGMSEEKYQEHLNLQAPRALAAAQLLAREETVSLAMPDPALAIEPITFEGEVVHATPNVAFIYDYRDHDVVPVRTEQTGKPLAVGDHAAYVVSSVGSAIVRHTPAEMRLPELQQEHWLSALSSAESTIAEYQELDVLGQHLHVDPKELVRLGAADIRGLRSGFGKADELIVAHALTTNEMVYGAVELHDGRIGYVGMPAWDNLGVRAATAWEFEGNGYARLELSRNGQVRIEPLLPSERDEILRLPKREDVPRLTLASSRLRMQVIADVQTLEVKEARFADVNFPAKLIAKNDKSFALDVSSASEDNVRTRLVLGRSDLDLDILDSLGEGDSVQLSVTDGALSVESARPVARELALVGPQNDDERALRDQIANLESGALKDDVVGGQSGGR